MSRSLELYAVDQSRLDALLAGASRADPVVVAFHAELDPDGPTFAEAVGQEKESRHRRAAVAAAVRGLGRHLDTLVVRDLDVAEFDDLLGSHGAECLMRAPGLGFGAESSPSVGFAAFGELDDLRERLAEADAPEFPVDDIVAAIEAAGGRGLALASVWD